MREQLGSKEASGTIKLYTGENVTLDTYEVYFSPKPMEECEVVVGTIRTDEDFTVEARSDVAGVRPCYA